MSGRGAARGLDRPALRQRWRSRLRLVSHGGSVNTASAYQVARRSACGFATVALGVCGGAGGAAPSVAVSGHAGPRSLAPHWAAVGFLVAIERRLERQTARRGGQAR